jgi:glycosyltransferase involved in cell wall biosynthesis
MNVAPKVRQADDPQPRVSVVIIFLNEARFLQEAVNSVLAQTFDAWELLLVDDGSTEGSTAIAKSAARRLPQKVRYLEHEDHANRGMSASRNVGLRHARAEYILFLDGDDVLTRQALSEQVALMEAHPEVGMVYGPLQCWFGWNGDPHEQRRDYIQDLYVEPNTVIHPPASVPIFLRNESALPQGNLFRTSLVREVGGFEDEFKDLYEDQAFRVKFCLRFPLYASNPMWYKYRKHDGSSCAQGVKLNKFHEAEHKFLHWTENYLLQHHIRDFHVWSALRKRLAPHRYPRLTMVKKHVSRMQIRMAWRIIEAVSPMARRAIPKVIREKIWNYLNDMKIIREC